MIYQSIKAKVTTRLMAELEPEKSRDLEKVKAISLETIEREIYVYNY